mmetsp:Transcript_964/g.1376  ORF Transcript_964/g.1376 Transcript_964/m.1376 type:complete len:90 (-) Transcript_964:530-799(-)
MFHLAPIVSAFSKRRFSHGLVGRAVAGSAVFVTERTVGNCVGIFVGRGVGSFVGDLVGLGVGLAEGGFVGESVASAASLNSISSSKRVK